MPVDTRQKRNTALSFLVPIFVPGVAPASGIDQADRQAAVQIYSGILAGGAGHPAVRRLGGVAHIRIYGVRGVVVYAPYEHLEYGW